MKKILIYVFSLAALLGSSIAQSPLTTTWSWNNNYVQALYMTINPNVPIDITSIDIGSNSYAGTVHALNFYTTIPGIATHAGSERIPTNWVLVGTGTLVSSGHGNAAPVTLSSPITLLTGAAGFAVHSPGHGFTYTNGTSTYSNNELAVHSGTGTGTGFWGITWPCIVNANFHYAVNTSLITIATSTPYGTGCGGSPLNFTPVDHPITGTTATALVANATSSIGGVTMGFSDTHLSGFPLLPMELSSIGMPGCYLYHSNDVFGLPVTPLTASTWQFDYAIPSLGSLLGSHVYLQACCLSPGENQLQLIVSNGINWLIGNQ